MPDITVITPEATAGIPEAPVETPQNAVEQTLDAAAAVVGMAAALADQTGNVDRADEILERISAMHANIRDVFIRLSDMMSKLDTIVALQVVDIESEETAEVESPAEEAPTTEVNIAAEGGVIEKEVPMTEETPIAEARTEKLSRKWL